MKKTSLKLPSKKAFSTKVNNVDLIMVKSIWGRKVGSLELRARPKNTVRAVDSFEMSQRLSQLHWGKPELTCLNFGNSRQRLYTRFASAITSTMNPPMRKFCSMRPVLLALEKLELATDLVHPRWPREQVCLTLHWGDRVLLLKFWQQLPLHLCHSQRGHASSLLALAAQWTNLQAKQKTLAPPFPDLLE